MIFQQKKFVLKNKVESAFCPAEKDDAGKTLDKFSHSYKVRHKLSVARILPAPFPVIMRI